MPKEDGSLELRYERIYGNTHLGILLLKKIGIKPSEKKVVYFIWIFQMLVIAAGLVIFKEGIFHV